MVRSVRCRRRRSCGASLPWASAGRGPAGRRGGHPIVAGPRSGRRNRRPAMSPGHRATATVTRDTDHRGTNVEPYGADDGVHVGSMLYTLVDPNPGFEVAYNRWYERDHLYSGCMVGPWLFANRRWVATKPLKDLRFPTDVADDVAVADPITRGSYLATYFIHKGHEAEHFAWANKQVFELYEQRPGLRGAHPRAHLPVLHRRRRPPRPRRRARPHGARPPVPGAGQRARRPRRRRRPPRVRRVVHLDRRARAVRGRRRRLGLARRPGDPLAPDHPQGRRGQRTDEARHRARAPASAACR